MYLRIRDAIVTRFLDHFEELSPSRCRFGDMDAVIDAVLDEGANYGCVIFSDGGTEFKRQAAETGGLGRTDWAWGFVGAFMIRYREGVDIDQVEAEMIDKLSQTFKADPRLGGTTAAARFLSIGGPEPSRVGDDIFDWIPFEFEALDK